MLREVATHHRAQDEANTGGCIEMSHHQRALWVRHQVRQQGSADGQGVLEQPWDRKQSVHSENQKLTDLAFKEKGGGFVQIMGILYKFSYHEYIITFNPRAQKQRLCLEHWYFYLYNMNEKLTPKQTMNWSQLSHFSFSQITETDSLFFTT